MNYDQIITTLNKSKREFTEKPTNFLCIDASDKYLRADIKVMIFGQEKNSWYGDYINNNDTLIYPIKSGQIKKRVVGKNLPQSLPDSDSDWLSVVGFAARLFANSKGCDGARKFKVYG